ncbi:MAG: methylmalonyl-CoA carboxyltransferase [Chloroflexi bacterium]|nr:methylmalonyl-CoA carboxyltransferase [Chloroflexota bacterium]MBM3174978.1 methylmalonyl-CoA carboxyltransferase [Chloroflexota bacterium]MBM4450736.1 methylmalonyl-CoA carboxyltransferase [Chloroflexota bacterium]
MGIEEKIAELNKLRAQALAGGGAKRIEAQHERGKLSARERIDVLFDPGTFEEIDPFVTHRCTDFGLTEQKTLADSVVTGYGKINGRNTFVFSQDFTVFGGSLSKVASEKICKVMDLSAKNGAPVIGLLDSGGARIQEGVDSLIGYGDIFTRNTLYSGVVPQISVVMGPCAGGAVYSPAITDFIFMVKGTGQMYITGPAVIKSVTGEEVSLEDLGGAMTHATKTGNCHFVADNDHQCLEMVRRLLTFLPQNNMEEPPFVVATDNPNRMDEELLRIIPDDPNKTYDMKQIITRVVDNGDLMEVHENFARNLIVGFARLGGHSVGIVAQQPLVYAGVIDVDASDKGSRFVRFCDCFNIPIITFVDVPGYMPGTEQEYKGIIRHGAKFLYAYAEATVPKISIITRKAYGGAFVVMSSKSLRGDINYAWPTAEIAVMGPDGAVNIVFKDVIDKAANPKEERQKLVAEYKEKFANPYVAASKGYLDDVIDPRATRPKVIKALEMQKNKSDTNPPKKHGNIPL